MSSNGKRQRGTDDYDDDQPARRQKILDTREAFLPSIVNTSSPPTAQPFSTPHTIGASPSSTTLNMPGSVYLPNSFPNAQYQEPGTVPGYQNDNLFREGRDFDLEVVLDRNDPRLNGPCYYLLQDVSSYQPGNALSQFLVAHGQLFLDDHGNLVRIKLRQPPASATGKTNNNQSRASPPTTKIAAAEAPTQEAPFDDQINVIINAADSAASIFPLASQGSGKYTDEVASNPPPTRFNDVSDVNNGHIGYITCPNTADGLTEEEFSARLEEWAFQVPRDLPATLAGWNFDAWRVLTCSGARRSDNNSGEKIPLEAQKPSFESYSQTQVLPLVDLPQTHPNDPAYKSDAAWTKSNLEVFGSLMQDFTPEAFLQPNFTAPADDAGAVSQQRQRINPYVPGGLFAQEFNRTSEVSAVYSTMANRSAAVLAERATAPPAVMPAPSLRQLGQMQARQTRNARAAVPASNAQPSRKRKASASNLDAQMPLTALATNTDFHNMMGQPTRSQPNKRAKPSSKQQAPASFGVQTIARPHQKTAIPHAAPSRSNIMEAMNDWDQGDEQYLQQQQAFFPPEQYFRSSITPPNPRTRQAHFPSDVPEESAFEAPSNALDFSIEPPFIETRPLAEQNVASNSQPSNDTAMDADGLEEILKFLNNST